MSVTTPAPTTTTTTPAPEIVRDTRARVADLTAQVDEPVKIAVAAPRKLARMLPPGPWTRAAADEGLTADELREVRELVEPNAESVLLWFTKEVPAEGVDEAGFREAWGGLGDLTDAQARVAMRSIAEYGGGQYIPGETA